MHGLHTWIDVIPLGLTVAVSPHTADEGIRIFTPISSRCTLNLQQ